MFPEGSYVHKNGLEYPRNGSFVLVSAFKKDGSLIQKSGVSVDPKTGEHLARGEYRQFDRDIGEYNDTVGQSVRGMGGYILVFPAPVKVKAVQGLVYEGSLGKNVHVFSAHTGGEYDVRTGIDFGKGKQHMGLTGQFFDGHLPGHETSN